MTRWKLPTVTVCALLVAVLSAGGCSKVRDPEGKAGPGVTAPGESGKKAPEGPQPVIACDGPEHDFGSVSQGEEARHTFTVKNTGKGVLKIERARGG